MGIFFIYILKSAICLSLFYLFYRLLLSRETFHRLNRMALLGILFLSLSIPIIELTTTRGSEVHQAVQTVEHLLVMVETMNSVDVATTQSEDSTITWTQILLFIYLVGILFFTCRNLYSLSRLLLLIKSGKREELKGGITLIVHEREISPFSWMKYIVISRKDLEEDGNAILLHEMAHLHNRHSIDLLLADVCIFFQWFNPGAWLLKQEMQNIHEYEVDDTLIREGVDMREYQLLLIKKAVGTRLYSMANSFNHGKLKKRITMMLKEKSSPWACLKYLYVLPLAAVAVTAFARPEISEKAEEISAVKVDDLIGIAESRETGNVPEVKTVLQDTVKKVVQVGSVTVGKQQKVTTTTISSDTTKKCTMFVSGSQQQVRENMKKMSFYFEKGGMAVGFENVPEGKAPLILLDGKEVDLSVANALDPKYVKSLSGADAGEYAIKKYGDRGKNGVLGITLYTDEELQSKERLLGTVKTKVDLFKPKSKDTFIIAGDTIWQSAQAKNAPLILVDGKEVAKVEDVPVDEVSEFAVIKREKAIDLYGEKGKNGVVIIKTLKSFEKSKK